MFLATTAPEDSEVIVVDRGLTAMILPYLSPRYSGMNGSSAQLMPG